MTFGRDAKLPGRKRFPTPAKKSSQGWTPATPRQKRRNDKGTPRMVSRKSEPDRGVLSKPMANVLARPTSASAITPCWPPPPPPRPNRAERIHRENIPDGTCPVFAKFHRGRCGSPVANVMTKANRRKKHHDETNQAWAISRVDRKRGPLRRCGRPKKTNRANTS